MKKLLLSLFVIFATLGMARAADVNVLTNSTASTWSGDVNGYSTVINDFTIAYTKGTSNAVAPSADHIRVYKSATLSVKNNSGEAIVGIVLHCLKNYCADIIVGGETVAADVANNTITWTGNLSEFAANASAAQLRISSIDITYGKAAAVAKPEFSVVGGTYYMPQEVALSCDTEGAVIHYTINGDEPTSASSVYSAPIKVESTMTIKALAVKGTDKSEIVSATYTIAEPAIVANIAEFLTQEQKVVVKFASELSVTYQNGNYLFIKDATGALQIFGSVGQTYKNGDIIPAGVMGTVGIFNDVMQLSSPIASTFATGTQGTAVEPLTVASNEVTVAMVNKYIKLLNVTVAPDEVANNYILTDDKGTIAAYGRFAGVEVPGDNKKYDITAIVSLYKGNIQLYPITFTESTGGVGFSEMENANNTKVAAGYNVINVESVENAQVVVVNALGQIVASKVMTSGSNSIPVMPGFYIVRVNDSVTKVIVK